MGTIEHNVDQTVEKMQEQLVAWGAKLDDLTSKAEKEARADYKKTLEDLKEKRLAAQKKLDELKSAGTDKWGTFKSSLETAWKDLETAFSELTR